MTFPAYSIKGREVEYKTFHFQLKSFNEDEGTITGYLSTFGNVDLQKDRVLPGAFKKTLLEGKARKQNGRKFLIPFLWMHSPEQPIGGCVDAEEDNQGLLVTMQLDISTNAAGIPNNSTATMVFSGYKTGYVDEMSMGYLAIQKEFDGGIRNLKECALIEGSAVTMMFAANPSALVSSSGVKSMFEVKTVCGNTSGTIGPRDEAWDGSKAEGQIWNAAANDDGSIKSSVAKKYFMFYENDGSKKGDYSYPFWYVGDDPHICVGAVKAIAGAIQGSRGAEAPSGLKGKVETLYKRISDKYPDNPLPPVPWKDDGKMHVARQQKTFTDHCDEEMAELLLLSLDRVWCSAFCQSVIDAFTIGDQPEADISEALDLFKQQFLEKFVPQAIACGMSEYLSTEDIDNPLNSYDSYYGWMSNRKKPNRKAGRAISAANQSTLEAHQTEMSDHIGTMKKSLNAMEKKVSDLTQLWEDEGQGEPYGNDKSRTRREPLTTLTRQIQPLHKSTVEDDAVIDLADFFSIK